MKDDVLHLMNYCYLELESDNLYDVRKRSKCIHVLDHSVIVKKKYFYEPSWRYHASKWFV